MRLLPSLQSAGLYGQQQFRYSAGPIPARYRLQVCRLGSRGGLEYGVRALERIPPEQLVCTYWGIATAGEPDFIRCAKFTVTVTETGVDAQGHEARKVFTLDPRAAGNLARWINCATDTANLTARLIDHPDGGERLPLLGLFAAREILVGEELRWDYLGGPCTDARASARPGATDPKVSVVFMKSMTELCAAHEMARNAATDAQHAAHWTHKIGPNIRSGCPRYQTKPGAEYATELYLHGLTGSKDDWPLVDGEPLSCGEELPAEGPWRGEVTEYDAEIAYWEPFPVFGEDRVHAPEPTHIGLPQTRLHQPDGC